MTSNIQIQNRLENVKYFQGVYASDQLPDFKLLPPGSAIIVNYSPSDSGGSHWCAMLHLNDKHHIPAWYDSFAFRPDGLDSILNEHTRFDQYLKAASEHSGFEGKYNRSDLEIQCASSDVCGELATFSVLQDSIPNKPDGSVRPEWRNMIKKMNELPCEKFNHYIINLVRLRI